MFVSKESVSTIDYFITSQMFCPQSITCSSLESGVATHRPVSLRWHSFQDDTIVKWIEKTPRPHSDIFFGPTAPHRWDIWTAQMGSFVDQSLFGGLKGDETATRAIELVWDDWLEGAEVEIRADFGVLHPRQTWSPFRHQTRLSAASPGQQGGEGLA